jgi:hypothetical protein
MLLHFLPGFFNVCAFHYSVFVTEVWFKMSGIQDSEAHFAARATEYGLPRSFLDRLPKEFPLWGILRLLFLGLAQNLRSVHSMIGRLTSKMVFLYLWAQQLHCDDCISKARLSLPQPFVHQWNHLTLAHQKRCHLPRRLQGWMSCVVAFRA